MRRLRRTPHDETRENEPETTNEMHDP
jgi:hypothetical protein